MHLSFGIKIVDQTTLFWIKLIKLLIEKQKEFSLKIPASKMQCSLILQYEAREG